MLQQLQTVVSSPVLPTAKKMNKNAAGSIAKAAENELTPF